VTIGNARLLGRVLDPDGARHRRLSLGALAIAVEVGNGTIRKWRGPIVIAARASSISLIWLTIIARPRAKSVISTYECSQFRTEFAADSPLETWAENPRSRTRRLVMNFRILEAAPDNVVATANFAVWRFQHDATDVYVGRYVNVLVRGPAGLLFRERRVVLDLETLQPHGKLSFIL
jgi:hypothetical protein